MFNWSRTATQYTLLMNASNLQLQSLRKYCPEQIPTVKSIHKQILQMFAPNNSLPCVLNVQTDPNLEVSICHLHSYTTVVKLVHKKQQHVAVLVSVVIPAGYRKLKYGFCLMNNLEKEELISPSPLPPSPSSKQF